jgi:hypothetical protein
LSLLGALFGFEDEVALLVEVHLPDAGHLSFVHEGLLRALNL